MDSVVRHVMRLQVILSCKRFMTYVAFIVSVVETMVSKRAVDLDETLLVLRLCETPHKGVKAGTPVCRVRVRKFSPTYFCACFSLLCLVMAPLVVNVRLPLPSLDGHKGHENTSPGLRRQLGPSLALGFAAPFVEGAFSFGVASHFERTILLRYFFFLNIHASCTVLDLFLGR